MKRHNKSIDVSRDLNGFVLTQLERRKGDWPEISKGAGVPYFTISKLASGATSDSRVSTVQKLANYFLDHPIAA